MNSICGRQIIRMENAEDANGLLVDWWLAWLSISALWKSTERLSHTKAADHELDWFRWIIDWLGLDHPYLSFRNVSNRLWSRVLLRAYFRAFIMTFVCASIVM